MTTKIVLIFIVFTLLLLRSAGGNDIMDEMLVMLENNEVAEEVQDEYGYVDEEYIEF